MGNTFPNIVKHVCDEYDRVLNMNDGPPRDYLVLDQVLEIKPVRAYPIDFSHLGTLFTLDRDKRGRFTRQNLLDFAELCRKIETKHKAHDFQAQFQAYCTIRMWCSVNEVEGEKKFVEWFRKMFAENTTSTDKAIQYFDSHKGTAFLTYDTCKSLHAILNVDAYGVEFREFFDLLQQVAEDNGIMEIADERFDYLVPAEVVDQFAKSFLRVRR